ncbi:serine hydrolase [Galbibacter sp. EGI 63066]|uniref:serine hydrolase n=1 Tax=Galbibacter sp. EGI 63066 TaxID=2993559 RepID=UPI00224978E4|nr:serine hydrolase [Galbibacter sp. EGI 63066]MCX2680654.1 serine hydrolase [Galbibacter sp. EGI 63066]
MKRYICLLLLYTFSLFPLLAQKMNDQLGSIVENKFSAQSPGAVIAIVKNGQTLYQRAIGKANMELDVPLVPEHVFRIGSLTKQFTAVGILQLMEKGKLSLDDPITKYIQDYPGYGDSITIAQLLSHTSGIVNYTSMEGFASPDIRRQDMTPQELINYFKNEPVRFKPGERFEYSNSGYVVLGYIIEQVSGMSYEDFMKTSIFEPLKMLDTHYDHTSKVIPGRVSGYSRHGKEYKNADYLSMSLPYAAGSLISSSRDLQRWNQAVLNNTLLDTSSWHMALQPYHINNGTLISYGLGWRMGNIQSIPTVKHGGLVNGFASYSLIVPEEKLSTVILTNCNCYQNLDKLATELTAIMMEKPFDFPIVNVPVKELGAYQGLYENDQGERRMIRLEDGKLLLFSIGGTKSELLPFPENKLHIANTLDYLIFEKEDNKASRTFKFMNTNIPTNWQRINNKVTARKPYSLSIRQLDRYVGKYKFSSKFILTIERHQKKLYGVVGNDKKELVPFKKHSFFVRVFDATLVFHPGNRGEIVRMTKIQGDEQIAQKL